MVVQYDSCCIVTTPPLFVNPFWYIHVLVDNRLNLLFKYTCITLFPNGSSSMTIIQLPPLPPFVNLFCQPILADTYMYELIMDFLFMYPCTTILTTRAQYDNYCTWHHPSPFCQPYVLSENMRFKYTSWKVFSGLGLHSHTSPFK